MKKIIYAGLVVAVLLAGVWFIRYGLEDTETNTSQQPESTEQVAENSDQGTEENITYSENGRTVTYAGEDGKDALTVLKGLTAVETESSSVGEYVTSINGVAADPKTEFWAFYVNGKLASEGAGTYQAKNTDTLEWRVDKIEL